MSLPRICPASSLNIFKFYANCAIHEAVLYEGTIMKVAQAFQHEQREEAFDFAYKMGREYATLISPCSFQYRVWVDVRFPVEAELSCPIRPKAAVCA